MPIFASSLLSIGNIFASNKFLDGINSESNSVDLRLGIPATGRGDAALFAKLLLCESLDAVCVTGLVTTCVVALLAGADVASNSLTVASFSFV